MIPSSKRPSPMQRSSHVAEKLVTIMVPHFSLSLAIKAEHASWLTSKSSLWASWFSHMAGASKNTLSRKKWTPTATGGNPGEKWYRYREGVLTIHDTAAADPSNTVLLTDILSVSIPDPANPSCSFSIVTKEKTFELLCRTEDDCAVSFFHFSFDQISIFMLSFWP